MGLSFWLLDGTQIEVDGLDPGLWHNLGPFPGGQMEGLGTWVLPQLADAFCNLGKMNWELQITAPNDIANQCSNTYPHFIFVSNQRI